MDSSTNGPQGDQSVSSLPQTTLALQESRNRLLYFYENASDLIHILRDDGTVVYVNRAWLNATGYTADDVLGKHILTFVAPDTSNYGPGTNVTTTVSTSHDYTTFIVLCAHDGRRIELEASITLYFKDGGLVESLMMGRDVTEKRATEMERRKAEARYRTAVQNIPGAGIMMFDTSLRYTLVEGAALEEAGFVTEAMRGRTLFEVLPPEQANALAPLYRSALMGNTTLILLEASPLTSKVFEVTILPVHEEGVITGGLLIAQDVTMRRDQEKSLVQAKEAAEAMAQARHNFVANMSHEIRTPLNAIMGFTQLLAHTPLSPIQAEYVSLIQLSSDNLLSLVNDVLDFAKADADQIRLEQQPFNLYHCLSQAIDLFAPQAAAKGLTFHFDYDTTLSDEWQGDSGRLRQIVMNLLSNAIKFTDHGTVTLKATTYVTAQERPMLHLSVSDSGIGIAEDQRLQIFDAFIQADTTMTRRHGGTGLGLAITKKFVELMHGGIWVESIVGQGATFHVVLGITALDGQNSAFPRHAALPLKGKNALLYPLRQEQDAFVRRYLTLWGVKLIDATATHDVLLPHETIDLIIVEESPERIAVGTQNWFAAHYAHHPLYLVIGMDVTRNGSPSHLVPISLPLKPDRLYQRLHEVFTHTRTQRAPSPSVTPLIEAEFALRFPLRILLVEDNIMNQRVTTMLLEALGYSISVVNEGFAALQQVHTQSFDVVFMDIQMPVISGIETARRIQALGTEIHQPTLVALTATTVQDDWDIYQAVGFTHYVQKPVQIETLQHVLRAVATPPSANTSINTLTLDRLAAALGAAEGRNIVQQIVTMFLEELPERVDDLDAFIQAERWLDVRQSAHTLKGSSSTVGATALAEICTALETHVKQNELADVVAFIPALHKTARLTIEALAAWRV